jgi:hypothetical protein
VDSQPATHSIAIKLGSVEIWDRSEQDIAILMSDFQGQGAFDCSPLSAQGIDGLCARLDAAARDDG